MNRENLEAFHEIIGTCSSNGQPHHSSCVRAPQVTNIYDKRGPVKESDVHPTQKC